MNLTPAMERFILHWGEMGTRWGINRTVAQIHALLYLSEAPLDAETIGTTLSVARSNVSTSLKELQGWAIVHPVRKMGDRREYYVSESDIWTMFRIILRERKKREIDPTVSMLRSCLLDAERDRNEDAHALSRIGEVLQFFEDVCGWYDRLDRLSNAQLRAMVGMADKVVGLLPKPRREERD